MAERARDRVAPEPGSGLHWMLKALKGPISARAAVELAIALADAVAESLTPHGDIRPETVIVYGSRVELARANPGDASVPYQAPERRAGGSPSAAGDVYAIAAMLAGHLLRAPVTPSPVVPYKHALLVEEIVTKLGNYPKLPGDLGDRVGNVVREAMYSDAADRPTPAAFARELRALVALFPGKSLADLQAAMGAAAEIAPPMVYDRSEDPTPASAQRTDPGPSGASRAAAARPPAPSPGSTPRRPSRPWRRLRRRPRPPRWRRPSRGPRRRPGARPRLRRSRSRTSR